MQCFAHYGGIQADADLTSGNTQQYDLAGQEFFEFIEGAIRYRDCQRHQASRKSLPW